MDAILEQASVIYEGEIDFKGQALAEFLNYALLSLFGVIAFLVGFITQDIYQTLYIGLGGTALAFVVISPPWPLFNKHPVSFLPSSKSRGGIEGIEIKVD